MKTYALILGSMLLLLFSCKSHKDVSRSVTNQTRGESLVTVNDSSRTHLETSLKSEAAKQEERTEYSKRTEFGNDNNVVSTTETIIIYNSRFDFKSQLDKIKREDFKYNAQTQTADTTSSTLNEQINETSDSRLIQGWEWAIIILTIIGVSVGLIGVYGNFKPRVL